MSDMRAVIVPKSDQLNADDLLTGPITITVREVSIRPGTEQPVSIFYDGDNGKPYKCCKSMARVMVHCWGADANQYVGRSMTLYCDPKVKWGGMAVGGIRISHMSHLRDTVTMALTETKGSKKPFIVQPLEEANPPQEADPLDEPNGIKWVANLESALLQAASTDEIAAIRGHVSVAKALAGAPPPIKKRINDMLTAAGARLTAMETPSTDADQAAPPTNNDIADAKAIAASYRACDTLDEIEALRANPAVKRQVDRFTPAATEIVETARGERVGELKAAANGA
jgi:hypothetical protein